MSLFYKVERPTGAIQASSSGSSQWLAALAAPVYCESKRPCAFFTKSSDQRERIEASSSGSSQWLAALAAPVYC
jgi:hypothetical protein